MVGEVAAEEQAGGLELSARISGKEGAYVLVVRQKSLLHGEETMFTLHFEKIRESRTCYQYHEIGHFWMEGQEQWRRLVYMAGTIYDKFAYVGEEVCTEGELELLRLVEFAPMAQDRGYLALLRLYRRFPSRFLERWLTRALTDPSREQLYETILQAVEAESGTYEKRDYGAAFHQKIAEKRKQAEQKLIRAGFTGTYPEYHRGEFEVIILEEHPFTVMEWDHFQFRIYYMVSQVKRQTTIGRNCHRQARNRGFFRGRGRNSWIFTEDGKNVADRIRKKM